MTVPVCLISRRGKLKYINPAFKEVFEELTTKKINISYKDYFQGHVYSQISLYISQYINSSSKQVQEYDVSTVDYTDSYNIQFMYFPLYLFAPVVLIQFRKNMKQPATFPSLDAYKTARHIAHDIKNPLSLMMMSVKNIQFLLSSSGCAAGILSETTEYIREAVSSCNETSKKVNELIVFCRPEKYNLHKKDLRKIVDRVVLKNSNKKIRTEYEPDLPLVFIDDEAMELAISKLVEQNICSCHQVCQLKISLSSLKNTFNGNSDPKLKFELSCKSPAIAQLLEDGSARPKQDCEKDSETDLLIAKQIIRQHDSELIIEQSFDTTTKYMFLLDQDIKEGN